MEFERDIFLFQSSTAADASGLGMLRSNETDWTDVILQKPNLMNLSHNRRLKITLSYVIYDEEVAVENSELIVLTDQRSTAAFVYISHMYRLEPSARFEIVMINWKLCPIGRPFKKSWAVR